MSGNNVTFFICSFILCCITHPCVYCHRSQLLYAACFRTPPQLVSPDLYASINVASFAFPCQHRRRIAPEWKATLTPVQYHILREKGTDPVGGKYDDLFDDGEYVCAACKTPLYTSAMKFACGCGWPGFWDCIPKTVREQPDKDGRRVEIVCNACNSHLGHVFRNEGFSNPPPNERHCVNNTSIIFIPAESKM